MTKAYDCPSGGRADTALRYLAGRLPVAEAQTFEEHYFSCADCREDVQRGGELRETMGKPAVVFAAPERRSSRPWLPLAAAAAIALVGVGLWQVGRRTGRSETVSRAAQGSIAGLAVSAGADGGFDLTWAAAEGASSYEVEVFSSDSRRLWKAETREPRVRIEPAVLSAPGGSYEIRVEALDALGRVVASGEIAAKAKTK